MVLAGVFAVGAGCNFGRVYLTRVAGQNITANLRNKVQWEVHIKGGVNILKPILRSDFILKLPIAVLIPTYPFFNLFLLPKHFKLSQT